MKRLHNAQYCIIKMNTKSKQREMHTKNQQLKPLFRKKKKIRMTDMNINKSQMTLNKRTAYVDCANFSHQRHN